MNVIAALTDERVMARPRETVVSATALTRRFGSGDTAVDALRGVSVDIARGGLTAVMGPSGSGKSTLMHILAGLDTPTSGSVVIDGVEIAELGDGDLTALRRDKIGFVFQAFNLLPVLTAEENLVLPLTIAGRRPDREWLESLVQAMGLGDRRTHRIWWELEAETEAEALSQLPHYVAERTTVTPVRLVQMP